MLEGLLEDGVSLFLTLVPLSNLVSRRGDEGRGMEK